tara:strand:+ start:98 stop:463 length:366 start_codon:yes stop_codon:yes gene_type:complete
MADDIRKAGKYDEYAHQARKIREGMERPNLDKSGRRVGESTHLMRTEKIDDRWVAFPQLFPSKEKPNRWTDYSGGQDPKLKGQGADIRGAYEEAGRRGERFEFGQDKEEALKFGRGSWKPK